MRVTSANGIIIALCLLFAVIALSYVLFHNPLRDLHASIFKTADNIRSYYRDQPNYWKLSTDMAKEASLVDKYLLEQSEYQWRIGQGENGDTVMPNDNSFDIALHKLSKSACINLSESPIDNAQLLGILKIIVSNENGITEFMWGNDENPLPIKLYTTRHICSPAGNTVIWTFQ